MEIDLKCPDNPSQIAQLQRLLQTTDPSAEDTAMAILLASLIFFKNRPGKLSGFPGYNIHGTGCHNPTSEKTGKTIWNIWRFDVTIENNQGSSLVIKREPINGGYIKAVFKNGKSTRIVSADISIGMKENELVATAITAKHRVQFMKELYELLATPLSALLTIVENKAVESVNK